MNCPRCKIPLSPYNLKDLKITLELDRCPDCGGIWFDKGELQKLDKIIEPAFFEFRRTPGKAQQMEALYCPSCTHHPKLEKAEHPRDKKVIIDYCSTCKGIWLDKGELEAIQKENWLITIGKIFKWLTGDESTQS
ncbi:MAG: zf-TFIIB domain-containing protein [Bacteroidales bacterium]|nr:zf-TFIIB domain-containing protein [Bacteroidales bacterium]